MIEKTLQPLTKETHAHTSLGSININSIISRTVTESIFRWQQRGTVTNINQSIQCIKLPFNSYIYSKRLKNRFGFWHDLKIDWNHTDWLMQTQKRAHLNDVNSLKSTLNIKMKWIDVRLYMKTCHVICIANLSINYTFHQWPEVFSQRGLRSCPLANANFFRWISLDLNNLPMTVMSFRPKSTYWTKTQTQKTK